MNLNLADSSSIARAVAFVTEQTAGKGKWWGNFSESWFNITKSSLAKSSVASLLTAEAFLVSMMKHISLFSSVISQFKDILSSNAAYCFHQQDT